MISSRAFAAIVGAVLLLSRAAAAQTQPSRPPLVIESMAGMDLFHFYCSPCHGVDGKGHGPTAAALKTPPADLTRIAVRNGGRFPRQQIIAFVSYGNPTIAIAAHGSRDMPVWGPIFIGLDPSAVRTQVRIENLVMYLESIQAK